MTTVELETDRLFLRPIDKDAVEPHIAMMFDPAVASFLTPAGLPRPYGEEWRAVASYIGHWSIRGYGLFSVYVKDTGKWVGRVGPWMPGGWPGLECGWAIVRECWGKGYAPEAAIATIKWTFDQFPDLDRIISAIDPKNVNSQAVATKIGETNSGEVFDIHGSTVDLWSLDREPWLAKFG